MIRPAERFTVNIARPEPLAVAPRALGWSASMPTMLVAAAIVGAGIGGMIPSGQPGPWFMAPQPRTMLATDAELAAIEPAAGPAAGAEAAEGTAADVIARAPDGAFYEIATLDRVPVTMRLDPERHSSLLLARDAARLVPGGLAQPSVRVAELSVRGRVSGPVELPVGANDLPASVLGADLLRDFSVVEVDRDHLRLIAR